MPTISQVWKSWRPMAHREGWSVDDHRWGWMAAIAIVSLLFGFLAGVLTMLLLLR